MVGYHLTMDQHVITDWKAYFAALGPGSPLVHPPITEAFPSVFKPCITFIRGPFGDLDVVMTGIEEGNIFDRAKEVYEAAGGPEMWVFASLGGQPWHAPALPKTKGKRKGK